MKNGTNVSKTYKCYDCNMRGFFGYSPQGADYYTCPCCGGYDFLREQWNKSKEPTKYDFLMEDEYDNDMRILYLYCSKCKIIFEHGCTHAINGCTDDVFNRHFIKKWRDKTTNIEYDGMPIFEDQNDWFDNVTNVVVLEMYCPHKGNRCVKSHRDASKLCCCLDKIYGLNVEIDKSLNEDKKNKILHHIFNLINEKYITKYVSKADVTIKWRICDNNDLSYYCANGNNFTYSDMYKHTSLLLKDINQVENGDKFTIHFIEPSKFT